MSVGSLTAALLIAGTAHAGDVQVLKLKAIENAAGTVYRYDGLPSTLKAGNVQIELTNTGKEPHDVQIVRIDGIHSLADVIKVIGSQDGAPTPSWVHGDGGIGAVAPGGVGRATVNLGPGSTTFSARNRTRRPTSRMPTPACPSTSP